MDELGKFVTVKAGHSFECLTSGKNIKNPLGDGRLHLNSKGSAVYGPQFRAKLWQVMSLDQIVAPYWAGQFCF